MLKYSRTLTFAQIYGFILSAHLFSIDANYTHYKVSFCSPLGFALFIIFVVLKHLVTPDIQFWFIDVNKGSSA